MKEKIQKILNKIKEVSIQFYKSCTKNYMTSIMSISIALIIIGSIIILCVIDANKNKITLETKEINTYYYLTNEKIKTKSIINYENNKIVDIKNNNETFNIKTTLYYKNHAIITSKASIIFPASNNYTESLDKYSEIDFTSDVDIVISNGIEIPSYNYFIYDNNDLYFFPEEVNIVINDQEYNLSKHSYVIVNHTFAQIYDYNKDEVIYIDNNINKALATYIDFKIDLLKDIYKDNKGDIKLLNIENNQEYKEER